MASDRMLLFEPRETSGKAGRCSADADAIREAVQPLFAARGRRLVQGYAHAVVRLLGPAQIQDVQAAVAEMLTEETDRAPGAAELARRARGHAAVRQRRSLAATPDCACGRLPNQGPEAVQGWIWAMGQLYTCAGRCALCAGGSLNPAAHWTERLSIPDYGRFWPPGGEHVQDGWIRRSAEEWLHALCAAVKSYAEKVVRAQQDGFRWPDDQVPLRARLVRQGWMPVCLTDRDQRPEPEKAGSQQAKLSEETNRPVRVSRDGRCPVCDRILSRDNICPECDS